MDGYIQKVLYYKLNVRSYQNHYTFPSLISAGGLENNAMSIYCAKKNCFHQEEIPNGLWDQRKVLLERRLKGKKGRTGKYHSPLGVLTEEPVCKIFNGNDDVFVKTITITPLKYGNKNLEKKPICVKQDSATVEACLNRAWERMTSAWAMYWNPAAAGWYVRESTHYN